MLFCDYIALFCNKYDLYKQLIMFVHSLLFQRIGQPYKKARHIDIKAKNKNYTIFSRIIAIVRIVSTLN